MLLVFRSFFALSQVLQTRREEQFASQRMPKGIQCYNDPKYNDGDREYLIANQ